MTPTPSCQATKQAVLVINAAFPYAVCNQSQSADKKRSFCRNDSIIDWSRFIMIVNANLAGKINKKTLKINHRVELTRV